MIILSTGEGGGAQHRELGLSLEIRPQLRNSLCCDDLDRAPQILPTLLKGDHEDHHFTDEKTEAERNEGTVSSVPLHCVPGVSPATSEVSCPPAEQVPTFRSLHTDHHPPLFPQIPDSSDYREERPLRAKGWGPCSNKERHGLLTPESRTVTLAHAGPSLPLREHLPLLILSLQSQEWACPVLLGLQ